MGGLAYPKRQRRRRRISAYLSYGGVRREFIVPPIVVDTRLRLLTAIVANLAQAPVILLACWHKAAVRLAALHQLRTTMPLRGDDRPGAMLH